MMERWKWGIVRSWLWVLACACGTGVFAQAPYWSKDFGGSGADHVSDVQVDAADNVYVAGNFSTSITVDGQTFVSNGLNDAFVAKLSADGALQWFRQAGGAGIDLASKLTVGAANSLAVCGQFVGSADLFGVSAISNGGTTDMFVARLNTDDGSTSWVRTGGSDIYSDRASAVAMSPDGNVIATGEFKGNGVFDGGTLVSVTDPGTLEPSFDLFICSWNAAGVPQWLQQGSAKYDDQSVEVVTDGQNNVYVTGQFSDTITFDLQHPNIALNNIYVAKFDPNGAEQWFRRCGGATYERVNDMRVDDDGDLLLCGDVAGTMYWLDQVPVSIPEPWPQAFFVLKVNPEGTLLQQKVMGSNDPVTGDALAVSGTTVDVLGSFSCDLTGLQTAYGANGIFMATGTADVHITRFNENDLSFVEAQQFGGHGNKRAGAMAAQSNGALVFSGSYEEQLFFPSDGSIWGEALPCAVQTNNQPITFCGDANYGRFVGNASSGLGDGFVSKGYVLGRQPYDLWDRTNNGTCDRPALGDAICVKRQGNYACADTVHNCGPIYLDVDLPFYDHYNLCPSQEEAGFPVQYLWSNGQAIASIYAPTAGWYWCTVSSANGCWQYTDSIYLDLRTPPQALLSDGTGTFVSQGPAQPYLPLSACDTTLLWCPSYAATDQVHWVVGGVSVANDSVYATSAGYYNLVVVGQNGCVTTNSLYYYPEYADPMPNITGADLDLSYGVTPIDQLDTVYVCGAYCVSGSMQVTWMIDGAPGSLTPGLNVDFASTNGCTTGAQPVWSVVVQADGWQHIDLNITVTNGPCGVDTVQLAYADSLYLIDLQPPSFVNPGPIDHCAGDTIQLPVQCSGCDSIAWAGLGIVSISDNGSTVFVDQPGVYYATAYNLGVGVSCTANMSYLVQQAQGPPLYIIPWNSTICPNDSALLFTTSSGLGYSWEGPSGPIAIDNDSIWVHEAGAYYLTMQVPGGCAVSNGPITLNVYASPFISVQPDNVLCAGESTDLTVITSNTAVIDWLPPLAGDQSVQTVDSAGTYQCVVSSCNIDWPLQITISASGLNADPGQGPWPLCEGGAITIDGPPGGLQYIWLPDSVIASSITVDAPQDLQLVMFDDHGCVDTSAVIEVTMFSFAQQLQTSADTVCMGTYADLFATGSGNITWYGDTLGSQSIASGPSIYIGPLLTNTTIYAVQSEAGCTSDPVPANAFVFPAVPVPEVQGDSALCQGDTLLLSAPAVNGTTYWWGTPFGSSSALYVTTIDSLGTAAGTYALVAYVQGCASDTLHVHVIVDPCNEITPDTTAADSLIVPNVFSPNDDGKNDAITLTGPGESPLSWNIWNRWGQLVYTMNARWVRWDGRNALTGEPLPEGVYFSVLQGTWSDGSPLVVQGYIHLVR